MSDKGFLDPNNLLNIVRQTTMIAVMAVAMTFVLSSGEIDLAIKKEQRPARGSFRDAYPERLVALLLKGGSRYISLHGVAELDGNSEFGGKTVYTFVPPKRR